MRIKLEAIPEQDRSDDAAPCWLCGRGFVVGAVACWAYSDDGVLDCGPVCERCIEEGPDKMAERLEEAAERVRLEDGDTELHAELLEDAELLGEGVSEAPTIEELREAERVGQPS